MSTTIVMHRTDNSGIASSRVILRSDQDWKTLPSSPDVSYTQVCDEPACLKHGTVHVIEWGETPSHTAFEWSRDKECLVEVMKYPGSHDERDRKWFVTGFILDDYVRLGPERISAFMAHYNSAASLVAELNGEVA
ncbi:hypothetical protein [Curtobacterium sp. NPDC086286]|jgi:hypothetical protein|uniref:hypothetical protein n=1 Tax=Curtobacterium sp. NPDC086286 TaxID=3363964 RepID=UPI00381FCB25